MQSVAITTNVQIPLGWGVLNATLCDKVCLWLAAGQWLSMGTPVSPTNKTDTRYSWNIFESGVKHYNPNPILISCW